MNPINAVVAVALRRGLASRVALWFGFGAAGYAVAKNQADKQRGIGFAVYAALVRAGINGTMRRLIVCQAMHETDSFTSRLSVDDHNQFGMKKAVRRVQVGVVGFTTLGFAMYRSVSDSVNDYLARQRQFKAFQARAYKGQNCDWEYYEFAKWLKESRYYGESVEEYAAGMASCEERYFTLANDFEQSAKLRGLAILSTMVAVLLAVVYFLYKKMKGGKK